MRTLDEIRADFDDVDARLVELVARRQALAREAGAVKRAAGRPVLDPEREARARGARLALCQQHGVGLDVVEGVFAVLVTASRGQQG